MSFAGLALPVVIGVGPDAAHDGLTGPFDQALTQELGRGPAPVGPLLLAAFFALGFALSAHAETDLRESGLFPLDTSLAPGVPAADSGLFAMDFKVTCGTRS